MGSDRAGSNGHTTSTVEAPKVFTNGPLLIGITSSFRMGQILQYGLRVPKGHRKDTDRWVAIDLMAAVREAFDRHGWNRVDDGRALGGSYLLACRGRLYEVQDDYSALRYPRGEYSVGSGADHALGSLHASRGGQPEDRILAALEAAAEHVMSVDGPFDILTQEIA
jgi:hypothetical protein